MESLPARQSSQRRSSPESESAAAPQSTSPIRTTSQDSQTIFIQKDDQEASKEQEEAVKEQEETSQPQQKDTQESQLASVHIPPQAEQGQEQEQEADIPKCWICLLDATEDPPLSTPWRSPCPCALTAHETCLLDWIADIESPSKSQKSSTKPEIKCPQCKSPIHLSRPRDLLVEVFQAAERGIAWSFPKAALLVLAGVVYGACAAGGTHTIYAVFGAEEGARILEPATLNAVRAPVDAYVGTPRAAARAILEIVMDHLVHWRLYVGLPLITPTLILSRTSLADGVLPVLPVLFFVTQNTGRAGMEGVDLLQWPPSAEFAFAVLPYVRGAYNAVYKRWAAPVMKRWMEELEPRGTNVEGNEGPDAVVEEVEEEDNVVEIRVDGGIFEDWEGNEAEVARHLQWAQGGVPEPPQEDRDQQQRPNDAFADLPNLVPDAPPQAEEAAPPPQIPDNRPPAADVPAGANGINLQPNQRDVLSISGAGIFQTVLGALLFPTLAGLAGEVLKVSLPTRWIMGNGRQRTFLGAKWARTLVGGCLLVLGKDALMLYVRWRMGVMQRSRRVLDYERGKGRGVGGGGGS